MKIFFALLFAAAALSVQGAETNLLGRVLLFDGAQIVPNAAIPTPGEVAEVAADASAAASSAATVHSEAVSVGAAADALAVKVAALGGQQIVYGTCVSFGSQAIESPSNVTARVVGMTFPSNTVDTVFCNLYVHYSSPMASTGVQGASALNATWGDLGVLETEETTFSVLGSPVECTRMLVGLPAGADSEFLRAIGDVQETVVGQLTVLDGLTVNGVAGVTTTNSVGVYLYGLLVEPLEE